MSRLSAASILDYIMYNQYYMWMIFLKAFFKVRTIDWRLELVMSSGQVITISIPRRLEKYSTAMC